MPRKRHIMNPGHLISPAVVVADCIMRVVVFDGVASKKASAVADEVAPFFTLTFALAAAVLGVTDDQGNFCIFLGDRKPTRFKLNSTRKGVGINYG